MCIRDSIYLSPIFDNGRSLGANLQDEIKVDRSIPDFAMYPRSSITIKGEIKNNLEVFQEVAKFRPQAAAIWQNQLSQISQQEIQDLFSRIPDGIITPVSRDFATDLLAHNQSQILALDLERQISLSTQQPKIDESQPIGDVKFYLASAAKYISNKGNEISPSSDGIVVDKKQNFSISYQGKVIRFNKNFQVIENNFSDLELRQLNQKLQVKKQQIQEQTQKQNNKRDRGISL